MDLDGLYGDGARREFEPLVAAAGAEFSYTPIGDGVRVEAVWPGGSIKLDCYPDRVEWQRVRAEREGSGLSKRAHEARHWFKAKGVDRYVRADDAPPEAEEKFRRHGDWKPAPRHRLVMVF